MRSVSLGDMPDVGSSSKRRSGSLASATRDFELPLLAIGQIARKTRAVAVKMNPGHQVRGALGKNLVAADRREEVERMAAPDR